MKDKFAIYVYRPSECTNELLDRFCEIVNAGGKVNPLSTDWLRDHGLRLAFVCEDSGGAANVVAVGGLKAPNDSYHKRCFHDAGFPEKWIEYPVEFGWVRATKTGGMTARVTNALFDYPEGAGPLFATVRTGNEYMNGPLAALGFEALGKPYRSKEHPGEYVRLFVRAPLPARLPGSSEGS